MGNGNDLRVLDDAYCPTIICACARIVNVFENLRCPHYTIGIRFEMSTLWTSFLMKTGRGF